MIRRGCWLFLFLLMTSGGVCVADGIYVRLLPEVTLDHLTINLGDIAVVTSDDARKLQLLLQRPLTKLESLATPVRLTKQEIEHLLAKKGLAIKYDLVWGAVDSVLIHGKKRSIDFTPWIGSLTDLLKQQLGSVELILINNNFSSLDVPMGKIEQRADFEHVRLSGQNVYLPLKVFVDGKPYIKSEAHFRVRSLREQSIVTSPPIASGRDVKVAAKLGADSVDSNGKTQSRSKQYQHEGYLVKKNQPLRILVEDGLIQIESEGVALANANIGEQIKVRRKESHEILTGKVSESGLVIVGDN